MLGRRTTYLAIALAAAMGGAAAVTAQMSPDIQRAEFTDAGEVKIPQNWRQWVFVGSPLTPNALNGGEAPFPEFHNVYIEPSAFAHYQRTGAFAEGTQIAKELTSVRQGENGMEADGSTIEASGRGYFQGAFAGLELAVKDSERFADEPGGWAYFSFGHKTPPYDAVATAMPAETCSACHQANAAQDFVFTQFYPVLRAAKP